MKEPDQFELFKSLPGVKSKRFRSASGSELPYWPLPSKKYRVQLSDGALIDITKQSPGRSGNPRLYTKMPGSAPDEFVQARNLQAILAQIALLDHIRALNRSIQIKLKQQDDAARALSDLTKDENARLLAELESLRAAEAELEAENARLLAELESVRNQKPARWVNTAAVEWALQQELPTAIKLVLVTFAACADEDRESWPAVKNIAKKSKDGA